MTRSTPSTFTSYIRVQSPGSADSTGSSPIAPPALLTRTSRRPAAVEPGDSDATAAARPATDSGSVTSQATAVPPISAASASSRSTRRAAQTTENPAAARARAVAAPMPLLAPVTTAVRGKGAAELIGP